MSIFVKAQNGRQTNEAFSDLGLYKVFPLFIASESVPVILPFSSEFSCIISYHFLDLKKNLKCQLSLNSCESHLSQEKF